MEKTSDTQTVSTNFHTGLANNNGAQMGCLETIQVLYVLDSVSSIKVCVCVAYIQNHSMYLFVSRRITFSKIVICVYSVPSVSDLF